MITETRPHEVEQRVFSMPFHQRECQCGAGITDIDLDGYTCAAGHFISKAEGQRLWGLIPPSEQKEQVDANSLVDSGRNPISTDFRTIPSGSSVKTNIDFLGLDDILTASAEEVPWVWNGYLAEACLTVLGGREKGGKSTLTYALIRAILTGDDFLGRNVAPSGVVLLTEKSLASVRKKLEKFAISEEKGALRVVTRAGVKGRPNLVNNICDAIAEAKRVGAKVLIVDTLSFWAQLKGDAENSAGSIQQGAVWPFLEAAGEGLAVLVVHHLSKGTEELRGSTALGASVDIIVKLHGVGEARNRRRLATESRFDETPVELVIELEGNQYRVLGTPVDIGADANIEKVLDTLPTDGDGLTQAEIERMTQLSQRRVSEALAALIDAGDVEKKAAKGGSRGRPAQRYLRRASIGEIHSTDTPDHREMKSVETEGDELGEVPWDDILAQPPDEYGADDQ